MRECSLAFLTGNCWSSIIQRKVYYWKHVSITMSLYYRLHVSLYWVAIIFPCSASAFCRWCLVNDLTSLKKSHLWRSTSPFLILIHLWKGTISPTHFDIQFWFPNLSNIYMPYPRYHLNHSWSDPEGFLSEPHYVYGVRRCYILRTCQHRCCSSKNCCGCLIQTLVVLVLPRQGPVIIVLLSHNLDMIHYYPKFSDNRLRCDTHLYNSHYLYAIP